MVLVVVDIAGSNLKALLKTVVIGRCLPSRSFFNKGRSISPGLPFLQFCKKYDICNQNEKASGCAYGKISGIDVLYVLIERGFSTVLMKAEISG
jgi:hypothetical protein